MVAYNDLPDNARVWIYQSDKAFTEVQTATIHQQLQGFIQQWQSHGKPVRAWGGIKYNRFIVLAVDEGYEAPSGCSIDSSVAVIRQIEADFGVDMFNRMNFAYKTDAATVASADRDDFSALYANNAINDQTIVFNNLVNTKADLETKWEVALGNSWHANMV